MKSASQTSLSKNCKQCNAVFTVHTKGTGRGSKGSLRRVFCSDKCKGLHGYNSPSSKIEKTCEQCGKLFRCYPSKIGRFCSSKCKKSFTLPPKEAVCLFCDKTFQGTSSTVNQFFCTMECFFASKRTVRECVTCGKSFTTPNSRFFSRCSRKCQFIDQSNGKIKLHLNGRTGYRADLGDLYFKSALEADFARLMNHLDIKFAYEAKTFVTEKGAYTPDFYLPEFDTFVELKGAENNGKSFGDLMNRNLATHPELQNKGTRIIVVTQKEFIAILKSENLWSTIPNLEQRNYKKTLHLVRKHENQSIAKNCTTPTNFTD